LRVAAFTGGETVPAPRFRVRQYIPFLKAYGIEMKEFCARWGSWPPEGQFRRPFWLLGTVADWVPPVLKSHRYDLTLLQREMVSTLTTLEPLTKRPRVFDVDDAVWLNRGGRTGFATILKMCDGVICGNSFIAEHASRWNDNICLLPTAVDTDRYVPSPAHQRRNPRRIIGWSGLSSGLKYVTEIEEALLAVLTRHRDVVLRIVSDKPPQFKRLSASQFEYIPWSPQNEVETIQEMSVGLMPVENSLWARGKCSYKMLLYMSCGIPVVVSPVGMNEEILALGKVGLGPRTASEWSDALEWLLQNPEQGQEMGRAGRVIVEQHYSVVVCAPRLASFLRSVVEDKATEGARVRGAERQAAAAQPTSTPAALPLPATTMAERRRVLLLVPTLSGGGAERMFSNLLRHLDRSRFELHLAVLQPQGAYMVDIPGDVQIHDLDVPRTRYALPAIVKLVRKIKPHAVLSTLGHLNCALVLAKPFLPHGTRVLIRQAAMASALLPEETRHPQVWAWLYRRLYKRADTVVCLSDSMVDDMAEHFGVPRDKMVRIYNSVDVQRVRELAEIGENPYSGPGPHLVTAGRLSREKGFDLLLAAMPAVLRALPQARLTILGEGPLRAGLTDQARELGIEEAVSFPGFQQNPWRYFLHADLFVLSSRYEGLPNALLEALALDVRVVATDCPSGVREIAEADPRVVLVPREDPGSLAQAIVRAWKTTRSVAGKTAATAPAPGKFDLETTLLGYSRLLMG